MLLWMWFGIVLTMSWAVQVVYFNQNNDGLGFEDFKAIGVLASPIFYMKKSVSDMWSLEDVAVRQECKIGLEGISGSNSVQIGDERGIKPIEESAFVALARHRKEIHATTGSDWSGKSKFFRFFKMSLFMVNLEKLLLYVVVQSLMDQMT